MAGEGSGVGPGGDGTPPAEGAGNESPGGSDKSLESLDVATLASMVKGLRKEAADYRTRATAAEGQIQTVSKRLRDLEDAAKTQEQKEAEVLKELQETAALVPGLRRFETYVKGMLDAELKVVDGMKAAEKKLYTDLLATIPEDDIPARLQAISILKRAQGEKQAVRPGNESSPLETGGGASEKGLAQMLAWSPAGMKEARAVGLLPKT